MCVYLYIYIYIYMCVCVGGYQQPPIPTVLRSLAVRCTATEERLRLMLERNKEATR